jgi:hypothetical protein
MRGKAFEDSELRANAAGTCSLSILTCAETSHAHASNIHTMCKTVPPMANASQKELNTLEGMERRHPSRGDRMGHPHYDRV